MIQNIEDLTTEPIVGKFYMVPCVAKTGSGRRAFLPVTGPKHEDSEHIGFPHHHWHYDFRFVSDGFFGGGFGPNIYGHVLIKAMMWPSSGLLDCPEIGSGIEHCRRKCLRVLPSYPFESVEKAWAPKLREAYTDKRVTCGKCPHRGLPLSSLPRESGTDIVTCVGHGLRWDLKTGEMVR